MLGSQFIAGCILAGGQSRRMQGREKSLLPVAGKPMLAHVAARLAPQVERVFINANGPPERFSRFGLPVVADSQTGNLGPLAGIHAGMNWVLSEAPDITHMVTVSTDAPLIPPDLVARLAAPLTSDCGGISMASSSGRLHPVIALWPVHLAGDLERALQEGTRKVLQWTGNHTVHEIAFEPVFFGGAALDPFFNANTPEELKRLDAVLAGGAQ